jgi:carbonic anhydrase
MSGSKQLSRRQFTGSSVLCSMGALVGSAFAPSPLAAKRGAPPTSPQEEALVQRLLAGNQRFVEGKLQHPRRQPSDFLPLATGQKPFACVVGCADSRVSPELLFDQGIGDLFVIRIAGNYVNGAGPSVKGSVEYAVAELGVSLILVLGHSQCGAVKAAIQHLHDKDALPGSINDLVNQIKPAITEVEHKPGNLLENAIARNVQRSVAKLDGLEPILAPAVKKGTLHVAGGVYELSTGKVTILA